MKEKVGGLEAKCDIYTSQSSCQVERPDISHFPRLSLTQSVVFSWDHTHQVCLALVLQCSLASQLPL